MEGNAEGQAEAGAAAEEESPRTLSNEANVGLQNALRRVEEARLAVVKAEDSDTLAKAVVEYYKVRRDVSSAFAEGQRQFDLLENEYPG